MGHLPQASLFRRPPQHLVGRALLLEKFRPVLRVIPEKVRRALREPETRIDRTDRPAGPAAFAAPDPRMPRPPPPPGPAEDGVAAPLDRHVLRAINRRRIPEAKPLLLPPEKAVATVRKLDRLLPVELPGEPLLLLQVEG